MSGRSLTVPFAPGRASAAARKLRRMGSHANRDRKVVVFVRGAIQFIYTNIQPPDRTIHHNQMLHPWG